MLQDGFLDPKKPLFIRRGDLPHWRQDGALYFVTFRLSDSLPQVRLLELRRELFQWRRDHPAYEHEDFERFTRAQRRRVEKWLDQGTGSCILRKPEARKIVERTLEHFDGKRYELGRYAVAPNHVHTLVRPAIGVDLSEVLSSWKRHSSRELAKLDFVRASMDGRRHVWQVESFDHIVRNHGSLERYQQYIDNHL